jgi:bacillithiol system protein YtxJ
MSPQQLPEDASLQSLLASAHLLLFKHSPSCPISARAFFEYRGFCDAHPQVNTLWLHVIDQRSASLHIAEATGVTHESPQALWIQDGEVRWHASHGAITQGSLEAATATP